MRILWLKTEFCTVDKGAHPYYHMLRAIAAQHESRTSRSTTVPRLGTPRNSLEVQPEGTGDSVCASFRKLAFLRHWREMWFHRCPMLWRAIGLQPWSSHHGRSQAARPHRV